MNPHALMVALLVSGLYISKTSSDANINKAGTERTAPFWSTTGVCRVPNAAVFQNDRSLPELAC